MKLEAGSTTHPGLVPPAAGALIVFSNIGRPFADAALHRLLTIRRHHGVENLVVLDHRPLHAASIRLLDGSDPWSASVEAAALDSPRTSGSPSALPSSARPATS